MLFKRNALGRTAGRLEWTNLALHCYMRNCACEGCIYKDILESSTCQMKAAVLELKKNGEPEYKKVERADGTFEYMVRNYHSDEYKKLYEINTKQYAEYLNQDAIDIADEIELTAQQFIIAALLLSKNDKDKVCKILSKPNSQINTVLKDIYNRTAKSVRYKTGRGKLKEFTDFYTRRINEFKDINSH